MNTSQPNNPNRPFEIGLYTFVDGGTNPLTGTKKNPAEVMSNLLETIELAITAASTGHLVFGTLHTQSAAKTVDRIIDVFPADQQNKIRATLSESLRGVVAQNLFKRVDKKGRCAALEILVFTTAVANLVREGKTHQIPGMIQVGKKLGNTPLDDSIMDHLKMKRISPEEAYDKCLDKKKFRSFLATPPLDDEI